MSSMLMVSSDGIVWPAWSLEASWAPVVIEIAGLTVTLKGLLLEAPSESEAIMKDRADRQAWLEARDYRVIRIAVADVERDLEAELERLQRLLPAGV